MTTGRINQVTILTPRSHPEVTTKAQLPEEQKQLSAGARTDPSSVPGSPLRLRRSSRDHPFAPTEFPKGWSTTEARAVRVDVDRSVICTPQEEDTPARSRRRFNGYQAGLTPGNLMKFLAKGQQSTDLNTPERQGLSVFGCPITSQPRSQKRDRFARLRQEIVAAAGTCSGRSAPSQRSRKYGRRRCHGGQSDRLPDQQRLNSEGDTLPPGRRPWGVGNGARRRRTVTEVHR